MNSASTILRQLDREKSRYGQDSAQRKTALLTLLQRRRLKTARGVLRLHECLCFLRAYPDNRNVLSIVETMLESFAERSDLRAHREALANSGVAGCSIYYQFYWPTADWLSRRWPDHLSIDWESISNNELTAWLSQTMPYSETLAFDMVDLTSREWLRCLKGPDETDAAFLINRFRSLKVSSHLKRKLYENLDPMIRLEPGADTPSRTHARYARSPVVFQKRPLDSARPSLIEAVGQAPLSIREVSAGEGQKLIDLAREAMVTRNRDLDVFMYGDKNDVRLVDFGNGLQFACIGATPEGRLLLESVYGFLTLKNGVPTGYVLASAFMGSSELAYNVFDTYRGGESGFIFGRVLSMVHHLLGSDAFTLDPYQLGHQNKEGLESGAWWFYYKLGFRPHHGGVKKLVKQELLRMKKRPGYRSSLTTLEHLVAKPVFLYLGKERKDVLGRLNLGEIGMKISRYMAKRFGSDREAAIEICSRETATILGVRSLKKFSPGEKLAWERWSPLVMAIPAVRRWRPDQKKALVKVIRSKGGQRESEFVMLLNQHRPLRRALLKLSQK